MAKMNTLFSNLSLLAIVALLVCGCNKPDPKVAQLESRVSALESNLALVTARCNIESNTVEGVLNVQGEMVALLSPLTNLVPSESQMPVNPATGLPWTGATSRHRGSGPAIDPATGLPTASSGDSSNLDPNTGLPVEEKPKVLRVANRVTESNATWWRWAVTVYIANPGSFSTSVNAKVKFLDKDGFIIETKDMYHLQLSPMSTNQFSDYTLVELPGAQRVASIKADLEDE